MAKADDILFFDILLSILLFTFGAGTGVTSLNIFQSIPQPTLAPQPSSSNCTWFDLVCQSVNGNSIGRATAYIGWAIINLPVLLIYFTSIILLFVNVVLQITFSPAFSANGIPFLGFIWAGLQLYVIWEVFRTIRGQSAGV